MSGLLHPVTLATLSVLYLFFMMTIFMDRYVTLHAVDVVD